MTFNKLPSIFKQLRPVSIGFDNLFDHFENFFDDDQLVPTSTFPFYNIVKKGNNKFDIEVALAGYDKKDIAVEYADNLLHIKSIKEKDSNDPLESFTNEAVIHKGIAKRYFSKAFTIADDVEIEGAELKNGLLKVSLKKIVPEGKKPKTITVK
jgi:molecular chaperone IbpA